MPVAMRAYPRTMNCGLRASGVAASAAVLEAIGVTVDLADGEDLTKIDGANYDIVVCEGAVTRAPEAWLQALGLNGRLGVVERDGPVGKACLYVRTEDGVGRRELFDATPPMLAGFEAQHGFAF